MYWMDEWFIRAAAEESKVPLPPAPGGMNILLSSSPFGPSVTNPLLATHSEGREGKVHLIPSHPFSSSSSFRLLWLIHNYPHLSFWMSIYLWISWMAKMFPKINYLGPTSPHQKVCMCNVPNLHNKFACMILRRDKVDFQNFCAQLWFFEPLEG